MYNPFSLEGKTILVTGASSGIGQCVAVECSKLGGKLIITGRNSERLQETFDRLVGNGHRQVVADLTQADDVDALVEQIQEIEGLALCAGKSRIVPFKFCTRDKFDDLFSVNFFSPIELLRLLARKRKLKRGASVAIVASTGGCPGGRFSGGNDAYGASKAALWSMMKFAASELAGSQIRVNSVNPGLVDTPMIHNGSVSEADLALHKKVYPLGRFGIPSDIAYGIIYLLSDASSWMTGQSLVIDGGLTI